MDILTIGAIRQPMLLTSASLDDYLNLNTLFGAVAVLAVILLIMIVTYFVKVKPNLLHNQAVTPKSESSIDHVIEQITNQEQEELVGDSELVAVIMAAIYASLGEAAPADGLVVRSIRKVSSKKRVIF